MSDHIVKLETTTRNLFMGMSSCEWTRPFFATALMLDGVLDIGSHCGTECVCAKLNNPTAKVVAMEPGSEAFKILKENVAGLGIDVHQLALGDGKNGKMSRDTASVRNVFVPDDSVSACKSMRLSDMMIEFKISGNYCIKMNCEGGERYVFDHKPSVDVLLNASLIMISCHGQDIIKSFYALLAQFKAKHHVIQARNKSRNQADFIMITKQFGKVGEALPGKRL